MKKWSRAGADVRKSGGRGHEFKLQSPVLDAGNNHGSLRVETNTECKELPRHRDSQSSSD